MWKSFGEFIRYRRTRLGLTQRQLADRLSLKSAAFLSDIEAGNRHPSQSLIPALARILETPVEDLQVYDTRNSLAKVRRLLADWPEYTRNFGRIVDAVRSVGADEVLRRIQNGHLESAAAPESSEKKSRKPAVRKKAPPSAHDSLPL